MVVRRCHADPCLLLVLFVLRLSYAQVWCCLIEIAVLTSAVSAERQEGSEPYAGHQGLQVDFEHLRRGVW